MSHPGPTMESAITKQVLRVFEKYPGSWLDHWIIRVNCGGQNSVSKVLILLTDEGLIERNKPAPTQYPRKTERGVKWRLVV